MAAAQPVVVREWDINSALDAATAEGDNRLRTRGVKLHYVNNTRGGLKSEANTLADVVAGLFVISGVTGAVATGLAIASSVMVVSATVASLATPIGWAALGVAVVALAILVYRHIALTQSNFHTETCNTFTRAMGMGVLAYALSALIAAIAVAICASAKEGSKGGGCCGGGGGAAAGHYYAPGPTWSFWDGYLMGSLWGWGPAYTPINSTVDDTPRVGEKLQSDERELYVFRGDRIQQLQDGQIQLIPKS